MQCSVAENKIHLLYAFKYIMTIYMQWLFINANTIGKNMNSKGH